MHTNPASVWEAARLVVALWNINTGPGGYELPYYITWVAQVRSMILCLGLLVFSENQSFIGEERYKRMLGYVLHGQITDGLIWRK